MYDVIVKHSTDEFIISIAFFFHPSALDLDMTPWYWNTNVFPIPFFFRMIKCELKKKSKAKRTNLLFHHVLVSGSKHAANLCLKCNFNQLAWFWWKCVCGKMCSWFESSCYFQNIVQKCSKTLETKLRFFILCISHNSYTFQMSQT